MLPANAPGTLHPSIETRCVLPNADGSVRLHVESQDDVEVAPVIVGLGSVAVAVESDCALVRELLAEFYPVEPDRSEPMWTIVACAQAPPRGVAVNRFGVGYQPDVAGRSLILWATRETDLAITTRKCVREIFLDACERTGYGMLHASAVYREGLTAARRSGIGAARGQFMAFLDDDDLWLPDHLSVALDGLDSEVDLVYTTCLVADRVHHLGSGQPVSARYRFDYPFDAALLDVTNMIPVTSVVARRFDPAMLHRHDGVQDDWAMWLDLVRGAGWRAAHLPVATTVSPCPAGGVDDRASGEHSGRVAQVRRRASADTPAVAGAGRQPGRESSPVAVLDVSAGGTASQRQTWGVPLLL